MSTPTDPRAVALAQHHHNLARHNGADVPAWELLPELDREKAVREAAAWLRAAVDAGIAPAADRPTRDHSAILLDDDDQPWAEYPAADSIDDAIVPLIWAGEIASSRSVLEAEGRRFRLIGWSD
ncbi:hypothetical protein [Streptomyces pseudogriseolus]|uniref:hypothetical protein n=1 Tax=Streptomyces pseudogriseolus TaxID=36817 RepID=UPI003FA2BCBC